VFKHITHIPFAQISIANAHEKELSDLRAEQAIKLKEMEAHFHEKAQALQSEHAQIQDSHRRELEELKIRHKNESEGEFEDRISSMRIKYENQISQLKTDLDTKTAEVSKFASQSERQVENGEKDMDQKAVRKWIETSLRSEFDQKLENLKVEHQNELDTLTSLHSQQMELVAASGSQGAEDMKAEIRSALAKEYEEKIQNLMNIHNEEVKTLKAKQNDDQKLLAEAREEILKMQQAIISSESKGTDANLDLVSTSVLSLLMM